MSCIYNIDYKIYKLSGNSFDTMLGDLLLRIKDELGVLRLVLFCDIIDNKDYSSKLEAIQKLVYSCFCSNVPVITLVAQKLLDAGLVVEVHRYIFNDGESIEYKSYDGIPYVVVNNEYGKFLYAGGVHSSFEKSIYNQGIEVFRILKDILDKESIPVSSIVRQWNYIEGITDYDMDGNQHYQMFNNARSEFYSTDIWRNGYPAATGIGTFAGGVVVDIDAIAVKNERLDVTPIDNRLQVAAHVYSDVVLENADTGLTTPKFERAKAIAENGKSLIYVSGTAAIRGEESIRVSVEQQLKITLENIEVLVGNTEIKLFRVYLKNTHDYLIVENYMKNYKNIAVSYLHADVCRNELLVEIEGVSKG